MKTFTMKIPKLDKKIERELKEKFGRKNKETGKIEKKWFIKDYITLQDLEQFLAQKLAQKDEEIKWQSEQTVIHCQKLCREDVKEEYKRGFNSALKELKITDEGKYL